MRDQHYRDMCDNPAQYDKVIDWIAANNKSGAETWKETGEEFACRVVHACISAVIFGERRPEYVSTGMCVAIRAASYLGSLRYSKVRLAIDL